MTAVTQGQTTYQMFPDFAAPGQLDSMAYQEIVSFPASEVIQPGRMWWRLASDGLSVQQVQGNASSSTAPASPMGVSLWKSAREGSGSVGLTAYGQGGPAYQIGETVPVLMRGRAYVRVEGSSPRKRHS